MHIGIYSPCAAVVLVVVVLGLYEAWLVKLRCVVVWDVGTVSQTGNGAVDGYSMVTTQVPVGDTVDIHIVDSFRQRREVDVEIHNAVFWGSELEVLFPAVWL